MMKPRIGFIVYGVHKDGLKDPMGTPFIDQALVDRSRGALEAAGLDVVAEPLVVASKAEAIEVLGRFKKRDDIDAIVLFTGTWVWASNMIGALRDFSGTGKGILVWTHPGSQGWRPVGGLVLHGALKEIGLQHRFVYGSAEDPDEIRKITSWCRASAMLNRLNLSTLGTFGGRGMGQTCGVADPSQWMSMFGIDIDSRDTTELIQTAENITAQELLAAREAIQPLFSVPVPTGEVADRSIRLYLAIQKLVAAHDWQMYTIQSFPGLAAHYTASCFAQSMMLNEGFGTATLGDFNTALTVKLLQEWGDERVYYGDLQHIDKATREIKVIGDGACPPSLACSAGPAAFAEHGIPTEGEAGGLSVTLVCKPGRGVLARLGRYDGMFEMTFCRCEIFVPPLETLEARRLECGIPFWPHAFVRADADMDALVEGWNNEYAVLGYGESLYDDLLAFCEQTGIEANAL